MKRFIFILLVIGFLIGMLTISGCKKNPIASFSVSSENVYAGDWLTLTNLSVNALSVHWEITDPIGWDHSYSDQTLYLQFSEVGTYTVRLTAFGKKSENTTTKYIYVKENSLSGGDSGSGSSGGPQPIDDYKDFKYINTHKYPYRVTQTRDGVLIGTYSVPANGTKVVKCKCSTTEVHKVEQSSGYFDHPNNINIEPFTVDCSNVSSGGYYYYTIKCNTSKIKYVNGNSVPYTVDITCASNNTNYSVTVQGNSYGEFVAEAGCEYTVKFTQQSGYALWPSISTYTVQVDCGYTYTRNAPTNVKGEAEHLNYDEYIDDEDAVVNDSMESDEDLDLCNE